MAMRQRLVVLTALNDISDNFERLLNAPSLTSLHHSYFNSSNKKTDKEISKIQVRARLSDLLAALKNYKKLSEEERQKLQDDFLNWGIVWRFGGVEDYYHGKLRYGERDHPVLDFPGVLEDWPLAINGCDYVALDIGFNSLKIAILHYQEYTFRQIAALEEIFKIWKPLYAYDFINWGSIFPEEPPRDPDTYKAWKQRHERFFREPWRFRTNTMVFGPELVERYNLKDYPWEDSKVCYYKWIGEDILWLASDFGFKSNFGRHSYMNAERAEIMYNNGLNYELAGITLKEVDEYFKMHEQALEKALPFDFITPNAI